MKKCLTIEIEYPEGFDSQWDIEGGEYQVFHDIVVCELALVAVKYAVEIGKIESEESGEREKAFIEYLKTKIAIMQSVKAVVQHE